MNSKLLRRHVLIPFLLIVAFFVVALSPVSLLGCFYRGLVAFVIALASGILSISAAVRAIRGRVRGEVDAAWWILTALLCVIPVVALLKLA